ncbi:MAG: hypothetical protein AAFO81_14995 [Pseudomonadota bacterium]
MSDKQFLIPGLAAIALAILFPFYWIYGVGVVDFELSGKGIANGLQALDFVFLVLGALTAYFYVSVRRALHEHYHYSSLDVVFACMIGLVVLFHVSTFALDAMAANVGSDLASEIIVVITLLCMFAFGVLDIVIGVMLLRSANDRPEILRVFAIANLIMGVLEVTILLSVGVIVVFPLVLVIMAMYFMRSPEVVEFV